MPKQPYKALDSFRELFENRRAAEVASFFRGDTQTTVPQPIQELFNEFLNDTRTDKQDIKNLLTFLCNTTKGEWDEIAHMFL